MSETVDLESLRYPIGKYKMPDQVSKDRIDAWIDDIASFPSNIRDLTSNLSGEVLGWRYRPAGWTIQQVVHHTADSHMNAFMRFKLTLTEDVPTIKPYFEDKWAELSDTTSVPVSKSLSLIDGLHSRWVGLLNSMNEDDFKKELFHPEPKKRLTLTFMLGLYSWHGRHHAAHIKQALEHKGEFN